MRRNGFLAGAGADAPRADPPASGTTLDYQGYGFETGGFPPSAPGDTLRIPIIVTGLTSALGIDFASEEVTGWIAGLVSGGPHDGGDAMQFFTFSTGRMEIYRGIRAYHDFGTWPPSATVPWTFRTATCVWRAISPTSCSTSTPTRTPAPIEGNVVFDTGSCLETLHAIRAEGFTFGGVLTRQSIGRQHRRPTATTCRSTATSRRRRSWRPTRIASSRVSELAEARSRLSTPRAAQFRTEGRQVQAREQFLAVRGRQPARSGGRRDPHSRSATTRRCSRRARLAPSSTTGNTSGRRRSGRFENERGVADHHQVRDLHGSDGEWEFEVEGRGIPRATLIGAENLLSSR